MLRKITPLLFGLFSVFSFSQSLLVEYKTTMKYGKWSGTLLIKADSTKFAMPAIYRENSQPVKAQDDGSYVINQSSVLINEINMYSTLNSDIVYHESISKKGEATVSRDSLPSFNWDLQSKYKTIGDFKCKLAICNFRGSELIAWYTEDIPFSSGPWKFKGLPGLILEIQTKDNQFRWSAVNIKTITDSKAVVNFDNTQKVISYRSLIEKLDNKMQSGANVAVSRLPRSFGRPEITTKRTGIEKIYEWETTDEKK